MISKEQSLDAFFNSFGIPFYDENTVPDSASLPYGTYEVLVDGFGQQVSLTVNLYDYDKSWKWISEKCEDIVKSLRSGGKIIRCDGGAIWLKLGSPQYQRMADDTKEEVRRIMINITAEFLTA